MRRTATIVIVLAFAAAAAFSQTNPSKQSPEEVLKDMRAEIQGTKADIMAKNLKLTAEQAAKFWPLFETYQKEQNVIIDEQLKGIQQYVDNYEKLDDATALSLMNAHLDRDAKMLSLRKRYLAEFQKVLGGRLAVRAMQIDRRLSLASQFEITTYIPLAH